MGTLMFGAEDHLECLQPIPTPSPKGEHLCLGYRFTMHFVGAPVYLTDHGYILKVVGANRYYQLNAAGIAEGQKEGILPSPLPAYHIPTGYYLFGYSLWPMLLIVFGIAILGKRRKARIAAQRMATPISPTGPTLATEGDRYIQDQLAGQLKAGERISHQAYGPDRAPTGSALGSLVTHAYLAALTGERLFLIKTRVGAFAPLLENHGVEVIERAQVTAAVADGDLLRLRLADGSERTLYVIKRKQFSNQEAFLRDLPRLLGVQAAPAVAAAPTP